MLAERHPYVIKPSGKQVGSWAICFSIGELLVGLATSSVTQAGSMKMHPVQPFLMAAFLVSQRP